MSDQAHAEAALEELRAIEDDSLPDELATTYDGAVEMIESLISGFEESATENRRTESEDTPDDWDDDEWEEQLDEARDQADLPPTKGTITTKTISGNDYYYLQWRAGDKIKSQYICPVDPT